MIVIKISTATRTDLATLVDIENKIFQYDVISPRQMRYLIASDTALVYKADKSTQAVGYMILLKRKNSKILRVYSLGVIEEVRKLGVGSRLLRLAEEKAHDLGCDYLSLELQTQNSAALEFYQATGFYFHAHKDNYYTDGSSALVLRKPIKLEANA